MNVRTELNVRACLVYLVCVAVAWLLTPIVWGATCGLVGGITIARNPEYQQKVTTFMKDKGVNSNISRSEVRKAYQGLSKEDKHELMNMNKDLLSNINWFPVAVSVSAVVFGIAGFFGGLVARAWILAGAVPALSFLTNNLITRFAKAKDLPVLEKVIIVVFAQFAVCYLFAYCGSRLGLRQKQKKMANQSIETAV